MWIHMSFLWICGYTCLSCGYVDTHVFVLAVPTKKHLLMKWGKSQNGRGDACGSSVLPTRPHPPPKGSGRNSSPLFDEVSSEGEDFEVADRGGGSRRHNGISSLDVGRRSQNSTEAVQASSSPGKDSDPPLHTRGTEIMGGEEESVVAMVGPRTPLYNDDGSMDSSSSRPLDDDANNSLDSCTSVGKLDVDHHKGVCGGEVGPKTPPPLPIDGATIAHHNIDSSEWARAAPPSHPVGRDSVDEGEVCGGGGGGGGCNGTGDGNKSDLFEGGSECSFRLDEDSPMSPHNKSGNQGGKKKVCLPFPLYQFLLVV